MNKSVMIIDDSPTVRKIVEVCLRRAGFRVISFPDGVEALRALTTEQLDRLPDLIILDIDLPKMNGYEVARYLKSKPALSRTPIMMLTRHNGVVDRLKARLAGVHTYLSKPFTTHTILSAVNACIGLTAASA
ncbi:chemosensory pili system protein ChpA (sensor histidine kinase/response regulator) [Thermosporothrix hazakensis]|jgi:DNA-binding response OmpR family regulator|uniref:Chemosensory pili system protein ChpA (Sensor histidine kinase/response regulator) n=2 Tax=Thermosporothrix TaxID=768650 RepID=A0A326U2I4_THEHA|nr:response regulator [Thermosporothrix hazakensis]PZW24233.1 chemosensory pili system protein ChpA (sensor histidine kinase/response regulator) [Thermosporothrix hazakensis]BBH89679.1 response regulator [Thermosporothrix sp. COM3]GCE47865.1 response regulator [Thermosporothrix hazakensis]